MTAIIKQGNVAVPRHVAIIMDGNGRWAQSRFLPRAEGHRRGVESVRRTIEAAVKAGVPFLSLFAFSSENWRRPPEEVNALMKLFATALKREAKHMREHGVRMRVAGDLTAFSEDIQKSIAESEALTASCDRMMLTICANYGGRWDIVEAMRKMVKAHPDVAEHPERITEAMVSEHMAFDWAPEVDLMIRTGGEQRISNFILWQAAYAELYVTRTLWPDFRESDFNAAIVWFNDRERRFGMTGDQVRSQQ
ncbi:MAG: di-trans,poly-cis-decaprenylcistransferase [Burkholderiaceae bacterium]|nr:di-trans,poly-cis-decaprenylcistransferase [Burkholderiaceae bacterium]